MSPTFYHILHVISLLVLTGYTFYAFGAPATEKKKVMIITGVASVLMLVSGIGLLHKLGYGFPGWAIVKLVVWLALSGLAGIGFKKRGAKGVLMPVLLGLMFVALVMVYAKPF